MRPTGGWLMIFGGLGIGLVLWLTPGVAASSHDSDAMARQDFDSLVRGVAARYQMHAKSIPMMWLMNVCARSVTHGGVHGMRVVEFEDAGRIARQTGEPGGLGDLVRERLGERWLRTVRTRNADGSETLVYSQSDESGSQSDEGGHHMRLIVVDLEGRELDMVSVSLDAQQLAKWMDEQNTRVQRKPHSEVNAVSD